MSKEHADQKARAEQAEWDVEDMRARLDAMARALERRDKLRLEMSEAQVRYRQSKRRWEEACWTYDELCRDNARMAARRTGLSALGVEEPPTAG